MSALSLKLRFRFLLPALCAGLLAGALAAPAQGAPGDPLTKFFGYMPDEKELKENPPPPQPLLFEGPCGLLVSKTTQLYVANYYFNRIDIFPSPDAEFEKPEEPISNLDPDSGPCGMAADAPGNLYVNIYHRSVLKDPPVGPTTILDSDESTGVAATKAGTVFVNNRTHVSVYNSSGAKTDEYGAASLGDAYGIAVSEFPATEGRLYVPDAADDTLKVFDPEVDKEDPVALITGPGVGEEFSSLEDSAVAVDRVTGNVYVADNLEPLHTERPEAAIYVFDSVGSYLGRLKYNIVDALPPGLAVDNSLAEETQGRVYVSSGDSEGAFVYVYPPNSQGPTGLPAPDGEGPLEEGESEDGGTSGFGSTAKTEIAARTTAAVQVAPAAAGPSMSTSMQGKRERAKKHRHARKARAARKARLRASRRDGGDARQRPVD